MPLSKETKLNYFLEVDENVEKSSRWKHVGLIEIYKVARKKIGVKIFWTLKFNVLP